MMKIKARKEQIEYTKNLLKIANFGQRGDGSKEYNNGNAEEQFVGILTQTMIADLLYQERPQATKEGDRGVDFEVYGVKIDVKSMGRHCDVKDFYIHNLHGDQTGRYYTNDVYLFCSLNKEDYTLTLCGWVTKNNSLKELISILKEL